MQLRTEHIGLTTDRLGILHFCIFPSLPCPTHIFVARRTAPCAQSPPSPCPGTGPPHRALTQARNSGALDCILRTCDCAVGGAGDWSLGRAPGAGPPGGEKRTAELHCAKQEFCALLGCNTARSSEAGDCEIDIEIDSEKGIEIENEMCRAVCARR